MLMGIENDPIPIDILVPISTFTDADKPNQSIFYNTIWESSNSIPIPCNIMPWSTPALPEVEGSAHLYMKIGSNDLFFSTKLGGELNISASGGTGNITGSGSSTADAIVRWSGTGGTLLKNSTATIDDVGNLTATSYKIGINTVLSAGVLGATVTASSLTSAAAMNINSGQVYAVAGTTVLSSNTLGTTVTTSSLTTVGALASGSIVSGFGSINIGGNTVTCGSVVSTSVAASTISSISYRISTNTVLSGDTLGSTITNSSLNTVGDLVSGTISSGFGSIDIGANSIKCGDCTATQYKINITTVLTATTLGSTVVNSSLTSAASMDINVGQSYKINTIPVLSATTLGSTVVSSSLTSAASMNINTGQVYAIASVPVLSSTTLGSTVTASSLTSIGVQTAGVDIATGQTYKVNAVSVLSATTLGSTVTGSSLTSATSMNINTGQVYAIASVSVLSSTTLGSTVVNSSLTSIGIQAAGVDIATGQAYKVNSLDVLSSTTLGSTVVNSSLTSIGTQASGVNIATGQTYKVNGTTVLSATALGSTVTSSSLTSAISMNINAHQAYAINFVNVLSSTTLGYGVVNSGLTSLGIQAAGVNIATGQTYKVDATDVLSATTLGSTVINSSLTSIGTQAAGVNIATGQTYKVNSIDVLSSTALGTGVLASSLTSVGILSGLAVGGASDALALVTMSSTSKGLLIPRMTTAQKTAITGTIPAGLLVYDNTLLAINHYNGSAWSSIISTPVVVPINNTNSPYTLTKATDILVCTASSGAIIITLPTAVGNSGKIFRLIRTDTTLANVITINTTSSQTIGVGFTTRYMWTANESWTIVSDGAHWQIISHVATTPWSSPETNIITGTTSPPSPGTGGTNKNFWRRDGQIAEINMRYTPGTGAGGGSGDYIHKLPAGLDMDLSMIQTYTTTEGAGFYSLGNGVIGYGAVSGGSSDVGVLNCIAYSATQYRLAAFTTGSTPSGYIGSGYFGYSSTTTQINVMIRVAIDNWDS